MKKEIHKHRYVTKVSTDLEKRGKPKISRAINDQRDKQRQTHREKNGQKKIKT